MSDLISDFRRNHLIVALMTSTVKKRSLTSLMKEEKLSLSRKEKEDIKLDVMKGVNCLHDNYIIHGRISPEYIIIDEVRDRDFGTLARNRFHLPAYFDVCVQYDVGSFIEKNKHIFVAMPIHNFVTLTVVIISNTVQEQNTS